MATTYSRTMVQEFENGKNIIHFPDLTDEERARREEQLHRAAERFLRAVEKARLAESKKSN